jgi:serine/threonine protein phosphatase PrpC
VEARVEPVVRELLADAAAGRATLAGVGASALVCLIPGSTMELAQVGNVRAYRNGSQLTTDHALPPPLEHILTQGLGSRLEAPDLLTVDLIAGDRFLFCTDVPHRWIPDPAFTSPTALRDAALARGSHDNIGVLLLTVTPGKGFCVAVQNDPPRPS